MLWEAPPPPKTMFCDHLPQHVITVLYPLMDILATLWYLVLKDVHHH